MRREEILALLDEIRGREPTSTDIARVIAQASGGYLEGERLQTNQASPHVWLHLPGRWTSDEFVAAARASGVYVNASGGFAVGDWNTVVALDAKVQAHQIPDVLFVFDDENPARLHCLRIMRPHMF